MATSPPPLKNKLSPAAQRERERLQTFIQGVRDPAKSLNELLSLRKEDAPRFISLAARYLEREDLETAQTAAEAAVACDPESVEAMATLGITLAKNKEFSRAVVCFQRVVAKRPDDVAQWTNLGESCLATLDYPAAAAAFRRAMELDPDSAHPQGRRARAIVARTLMKLQKRT